MKILFHACCAPCSSSCIEGLRDKDLLDKNLSIKFFWYNHNIHPLTEFEQRRHSLVSLALAQNIELFSIDEYGLDEFMESLGLESAAGQVKLVAGQTEPGTATRCAACYRTRLERTALAAKEQGFDAFSTTLLTSPYQKHDLIKQIGEECAVKFGIEFFYMDFRPWFRPGQKKAREAGSYMQKYCGCVFSAREANSSTLAK